MILSPKVQGRTAAAVTGKGEQSRPSPRRCSGWIWMLPGEPQHQPCTPRPRPASLPRATGEGRGEKKNNQTTKHQSKPLQRRWGREFCVRKPCAIYSGGSDGSPCRSRSAGPDRLHLSPGAGRREADSPQSRTPSPGSARPMGEQGR